MVSHNPNIPDSITCSKCGAEKPRYQPRRLVCRECHNEYMRARHAANPERENTRGRKRRQCAEYRVKAREYQRGYYLANKERRREKRRWRRANDDSFRIVERVSSAVRKAAITSDREKKHRTAHYLGYPLAELKAWVARQGGIPPDHHIDHIIPVKWWLNRYPDDIVRAMRGAWRLGNLRIIPAGENLRKQAKREFLV